MKSFIDRQTRYHLRIAVLFILLLIVGCKKESCPQKVADAKPIEPLLVEKVFGNQRVEYLYDSDERLVRINRFTGGKMDSYDLLLYSGRLVTKITKHDPISNASLSQRSITYDSQNRVSRINFSHEPNDADAYLQYTYISQDSVRVVSEPTGNPVVIYKYDSNGNILHEFRGIYTSRDYTYREMLGKNPEKDIHSGFDYLQSKNLFSSRSSETPNFGYTIRSYQYELNEKGFPVKVLSKNEETGQMEFQLEGTYTYRE